MAPPEQWSNSCKGNGGFVCSTSSPFQATIIFVLLPSLAALRDVLLRGCFLWCYFILGPALFLLQAAQSRSSSLLPKLSWPELIHLAPHGLLLLLHYETPWLVLADAGTGWITASTKVQAFWDGFATPQLCAQLCTRSFWWKPWKNCCLSACIGISLILWFNQAAMELLSATGQLSETKIWKMVRFCFCCRPTWAHTAKIHGKVFDLWTCFIHSYIFFAGKLLQSIAVMLSVPGQFDHSN